MKKSLALLVLLAACAPSQEQSPPKQTMVVGVDVSGSFRQRNYNDAIDFAAYYIYGHLNGLGGLRKPTAVFVGSIGGEKTGDVKAFHPIHDFLGKDIPQIAADLKAWFPPNDELTDFNQFFGRVAALVKRQNLVLAPLDIVVLSDGIPDVTLVGRDTLTRFQRLDVSPLEYLSRNTTVRVLYPTPTVAVGWERGVKRRRVRIWTQDNEVMVGWRKQLAAGQPPEAQEALWNWVRDNVDFRVRARVI